MAFSGWLYRRTITIDHTVVDADLTSFPVLVRLTSSNFTFANALSTGFDVRFSDAAGVTLDYERERHDNSGQLAEYWVRVPSVLAASDTIIYLYYGNAGASDGAATAGAVWDSNHIGVYHLGENPAGTAPQMKDSTTLVGHGTTNGSMVAGDSATAKAGKGITISTGKYITVPASTTVRNLTAYTVSAWCFSNTLASTERRHIIDEARGATSAVTRMTLSLETTNRFVIQGRAADADALTVWCSPTTVISASTWYHVVGIFDSTTDVHIFHLNGVKTTGAVTTVGIANTAQLATTTVGTRVTFANEFWDGIIDELRISNIARSDAWCKADYNTGNGTLLTVATEVTNLSPRLRQRSVQNRR